MENCFAFVHHFNNKGIPTILTLLVRHWYSFLLLASVFYKCLQGFKIVGQVSSEVIFKLSWVNFFPYFLFGKFITDKQKDTDFFFFPVLETELRALCSLGTFPTI